MYERGEGSSSPVVVMQVDSCEQRIKDVEAAGGSVVAPLREVGGMGIYAQVKDTEDNIIGLWQPLHG
jgi:predicted enzyme related to lactoylglutathione lyase